MKKILYDLRASQPLHGVRFHGGGEYSKAIFIRLVECFDFNNCRLDVYYDKSEELDENVQKCLSDVTIHDCRSPKELERLLSDENYDVFFSGLPSICENVKIPAQTKFIYTIHGLREIEKPFDKYMFEYGKLDFHQFLKKLSIDIMPNYWHKKYRKKTKKILELTDNRVILTVSNHSKYSLLNNYPELMKNEIKVFNSPTKFVRTTDDASNKEIQKIGVKKKNFFLMVSAGRWLKNNLRAVFAFDELYTKNRAMMQDTVVVMTGVSNPEVFLKHIKNKDKFIMLGYVEVLTLEALYKEAHAFVYPTLNEGYGYPPIEAMKYGTLSLCSNVTSVPEVCGDAVIYFNPYDIMEIKNRILQSFDHEIVENKESKMESHFNEINKKQQDALDGIVNTILVC